MGRIINIVRICGCWELIQQRIKKAVDDKDIRYLTPQSISQEAIQSPRSSSNSERHDSTTYTSFFHLLFYFFLAAVRS